MSDEKQNLSIAIRMLIAIAWLLVGAVVGGGIWMVGMLLMAFSGDSTKAQTLPAWLEPTIIVGWPISLAIAIAIPPLLFACGLRWTYSIATAIALTFLSVAFYAACWIILIIPR